MSDKMPGPIKTCFTDRIIPDGPGPKSSDWGDFGAEKINGEIPREDGSMGAVQFGDVKGASESPKFMPIAGTGKIGGGMGGK